MEAKGGKKPRPKAAQPHTSDDGLGRSTVEAYGSIILGFLPAVLPMNWWQTAGMSAVVAGLIIDLAIRSRWTRGLPWPVKALVAVAGTLFVIVAAYGPVRMRYNKVHVAPDVSAKVETAKSQNLHGQLPGVSVYSTIKVEPLNKFRRKYVFEVETEDHRASAALYMTPDNHLTFNVSDLGAENYSLEIPLGEGGLPIGSVAVVAAEVGVASYYTVLQVTINGAVVGSRKVPFPINLGNSTFREMTIGRAKKGGYGRFDDQGTAVYNVMLSEEDAAKVNAAAMATRMNEEDGPVIRFDGNASMHRDAHGDLVADPPHMPTVDFGPYIRAQAAKKRREAAAAGKSQNPQ